MKIIFGLGNPGLRYAATRHNCGFLTLDQLAAALDCRFSKKEQDNEVAAAFDRGEKLLLAKPQSYMNLSGFPLTRLCAYYKVDYSDILVILDDLSLHPGQLRIRRGGSDGGHNGMKSIIAQCGTDRINRLKIGIGAAPYDTALYVTTPFEREEAPLFAAAFRRAAEAALCWARQGVEAAMNLYNHAPEKPDEE